MDVQWFLVMFNDVSKVFPARPEADWAKESNKTKVCDCGLFCQSRMIPARLKQLHFDEYLETNFFEDIKWYQYWIFVEKKGLWMLETVWLWYSHICWPHVDILECQVLDTPKSLVFVLTLVDKALTNWTLKHCTRNSKLVQSRSNLIKVIKALVKRDTHGNCTAFRFRSSNCTNKMTYKAGRPTQRIAPNHSRTLFLCHRISVSCQNITNVLSFRWPKRSSTLNNIDQRDSLYLGMSIFPSKLVQLLYLKYRIPLHDIAGHNFQTLSHKHRQFCAIFVQTDASQEFEGWEIQRK